MSEHKTLHMISGKVEPGETPIVAMCREMKEEVGLVLPIDFRLILIKTITMVDQSHQDIKMHLFVLMCLWLFFLGKIIVLGVMSLLWMGNLGLRLMTILSRTRLLFRV